MSVCSETQSPLRSSPMSSNLTASPSPRTELYKNKDKSLKQLRRRRSETVVELRKQKRENDNDRRRNISLYDSWSDNEDNTAEEEENQIDVQLIIKDLKDSNPTLIPAKHYRHLRHSVPKGRVVRSGEQKTIIEDLLSEKTITKLMNALTSDELSMSQIYELVALMAHLCTGSADEVMVLVKSGLVGQLLTLLSYDNFAIREQSVLAMTYMWNCCPDLKELVQSNQFLNSMLTLADSEASVSPSKYVGVDGRMGLVRAISWSLFILCHNHDIRCYQLAIALMPFFVKLIAYSDIEVKANVLKALSATTERNALVDGERNLPVLKVVEAVMSNAQLFEPIIGLLSAKEDVVVSNALRIIGNMVSWGESYTQLVIQAKALNSFHLLLSHHNPLVQKEATFTVSNITAGNVSQIQAVIDANVIPLIAELLYMGEYRSQVEASHVMLNISAVGSDHQIYYLLNIDKSVVCMDPIDAMASLLSFSDASVLKTCLQFYNNVLVFAQKTRILAKVKELYENCSALDLMEKLSDHKNTDISVLASHMMDTYFSKDTSLEEDMISSLDSEEKQMEVIFSF